MLQTDVLRVCAGMPPAVRGLVWDVFFSSRGRGVSLSAHFPWVDQPGSFHTVWLPWPGVPNAACAALVIKPGLGLGSECVALLGLVCVHPDFRGLGLSSQLLSAAVDVAHDLGFRALMLWTQMPGVYEPRGYVSVAQERLVQVQVPLDEPCLKGQTLPVCESGVPLAQGLPPFALSVQRWHTPQAQAVVLQTPSGLSLAQWSGPSDFVARLVLAALPSQWLLNALPEDDLPEVLSGLGCDCVALSGAHRMVLAWDDAKVRLTGGAFVGFSRGLPAYRLLQRI